LETASAQVVAKIERNLVQCVRTYANEKLTITADDGTEVVLRSHIEYSSPTSLSTQDSSFELVFPDGSVLSMKIGPSMVPPGAQSPEFPGSVISYKERQLSFNPGRPLVPVWTSKEGKEFRAALPASVSDLMQTLSEGRRPLQREGVLAGFFELFIDLYQGVENSDSGRPQSYVVQKVFSEYKHGPQLSKQEGLEWNSPKDKPTRPSQDGSAGKEEEERPLVPPPPK
jgi:hypothetical protein